MPTFEITIPNGKKFRITANSPEEANASLDQFLKLPQPGETPEQTDERLYGKAPSQPSMWHSALAGLYDTLTFGFGDEASAGVESTLGGRSYDDALKFNRAANQELSDANPVSFTGGQVAGAVLPALATGGSSIAPTMTGRVATGMGVGALQGATYGFGSGEDGLQNRATEAGKTGLVGAALGASFPIAAKAVGSAWNGIASTLAKRGIDAKAVHHILDMLSQSGLSPQQAEQRLAELGPDAFMADVSKGLQVETAQAGAAHPGASSIITERLASRREAAPQRVESVLTNAFGPAQDPYLVQQGTRVAKQAVNPDYATAIANARQLPQGLAKQIGLELKQPMAGMTEGNRRIMEGLVGEIQDALKGADPKRVASRLLDLRKRIDGMIVYDQRALAAMRPEDKPAQLLYKQARGKVNELLKSHFPGIAEADAQHAELSKMQEAFDYGRKQLLKDGPDAVTPSELADVSSRYNASGNDAMNQGLRTEIGRRVGNASKNPAAATERLFDRNFNRPNIESRIGPAKVARLERELDREATFTETSNLAEAHRGSRTAMLAGSNRWNTGGAGTAVGDALAAGATTTAMTGSTTAGASAVAGVGANRIRQMLAKALSSSDPTLIQETARKLTASGPARDALVAALHKMSAGGASRAARKQNIEQLVQMLSASQAAPFGFAIQQNWQRPDGR